VLFGVFLFNIVPAIRRQHFDPSIQQALDFIKEAEKSGDLSDAQVRLMYVNLYKKVLEHIDLDSETKERVRRLDDAIQPRGTPQ
jgi:hypothetical protein